jgi:uncharacterized protein (UPF0371 family)
MGLRKSRLDKVSQKTVCLTGRQSDFLEAHPEVDINQVCRKAIDEQIKLIDPSYIKEVQ